MSKVTAKIVKTFHYRDNQLWIFIPMNKTIHKKSVFLRRNKKKEKWKQY